MSLGLSDAVVQNKRVLVLDWTEFWQLLAKKGLNLLENLNVILSDNSDRFTSLAGTRRTSDPMHIIFRIGRDVIIDDDIDRGNV